MDRSECIILTYAADEPTSASSLRDEWLPELRRLRVQARNPPLHRSRERSHAQSAPAQTSGAGRRNTSSALRCVHGSIQVPVIVVGCRLDLREGSAHTPHASLRPLLDLR